MEIQESDTPEPKSPRDFRPWETLDFLPAGCFLYHQAARQIADLLNWSDYKLEALLGDMAEAINAKALPTVSRKTGLRVPKDREPEFLGVVTVDDVNAWLTARGAPYRWTPTEQAPAPAQSTAQHDTTDTRGRKGLPTPDIAVLFDGAPFTKNEWNKRINERKWLEPARIAKGEQGGAPAMWCPLNIGQLVWEKEPSKRAMLKRIFQNPALAPWRDEWDQFVDVFSNDD